MKIIILGAPGSGKGTQAALICKTHNIPHVSTGDLLRKNIADGTELGKKAKSYMDAGQFVPDELVIDLLKARIAEPDCKDGFLLDGFPRNKAQAEVLDGITDIDMVINLDVDLGAIADRMASRRVCPVCGYSTSVQQAPDGKCKECGADLIVRDDDKREVVEDRLKVYKKKTAPLIKYYNKKKKLHSVDGMQAIDAVNKDIEVEISTEQYFDDVCANIRQEAEETRQKILNTLAGNPDDSGQS